eukprot:CAMPEP_0168550746 /NCGR_PEP_ID=MMETSP0413-20121227/5806_1 /TAXON_ID=136452 /ORGANISM="Filamoeba nolandi, Strain NC-AS-23-1" /LENGTH=106 /DNA_ID=CAMNT_0008581231 /DNA_START=164 /DNA_END=484 /DNA_ORIENTATION=+
MWSLFGLEGSDLDFLCVLRELEGEDSPEDGDIGICVISSIGGRSTFNAGLLPALGGDLGSDLTSELSIFEEELQERGSEPLEYVKSPLFLADSGLLTDVCNLTDFS